MKTAAGTLDNKILIERCLRGDGEAWRALVDRYARLVHSVPVRYGLSQPEVDDVGQEVFLALARNLHRIEDPDRLPAWLLTTARRASWRALSQRKREQPGFGGDVGELEVAPGLAVGSAGGSVPSMRDLLAGWARQEALGQAMARLRERCRILLTLLFLDPDEPSYDEISARLGVSKGSIGPTRTRCLAQLRAILEGLGFSAGDV
jgi:RNA polymerase sigma factor (sigma-70 family)